MFDGENISFDASLVINIYIYVYVYIYIETEREGGRERVNIPLIMIINRIYEHENLLSL